jgi:hypothetical protein
MDTDTFDAWRRRGGQRLKHIQTFVSFRRLQKAKGSIELLLENSI